VNVFICTFFFISFVFPVLPFIALLVRRCDFLGRVSFAHLLILNIIFIAFFFRVPCRWCPDFIAVYCAAGICGQRASEAERSKMNADAECADRYAIEFIPSALWLMRYDAALPSEPESASRDGYGAHPPCLSVSMSMSTMSIYYFSCCFSLPLLSEC